MTNELFDDLKQAFVASAATMLADVLSKLKSNGHFNAPAQTTESQDHSMRQGEASQQSEQTKVNESGWNAARLDQMSSERIELNAGATTTAPLTHPFPPIPPANPATIPCHPGPHASTASLLQRRIPPPPPPPPVRDRLPEPFWQRRRLNRREFACNGVKGAQQFSAIKPGIGTDTTTATGALHSTMVGGGTITLQTKLTTMIKYTRLKTHQRKTHSTSTPH